MKRSLVLITLILLVIGCTERISFDTSNDDELIIIDGFITDAPGPHHVKISKSIKFTNEVNEGQQPAVRNALVTIEDDLGNVVTLVEFEPGNYITPSSFSGIAGRTYTMRAILEDGREIVSTRQTLKRSGEIQNIYYQLTLNTTDLYIPFDITYYMDFSFSDDKQYYKWDLEETYMFPTLCIDRGFPCRDPSMYGVDENVPHWCYVTDSIPENYVNLAAAEDYTTDEVKDHPMVYIQKFGFKFITKHTYKLNQYSISKEAYDYWKKIDTQVNSNGTIFDPAPIRIEGNLSIPGDASTIVLGFFGAYGVTSKRIFVSGGSELVECRRVEFVPGYCDDCRWWANGLPEKPDYWED